MLLLGVRSGRCETLLPVFPNGVVVGDAAWVTLGVWNKDVPGGGAAEAALAEAGVPWKCGENLGASVLVKAGSSTIASLVRVGGAFSSVSGGIDVSTTVADGALASGSLVAGGESGTVAAFGASLRRVSADS